MTRTYNLPYPVKRLPDDAPDGIELGPGGGYVLVDRRIFWLVVVSIAYNEHFDSPFVKLECHDRDGARLAMRQKAWSCLWNGATGGLV